MKGNLCILCLFVIALFFQPTLQEGIVFVDQVDPVPNSGAKFTNFQHIVSQNMQTVELDAENITLTNPSGAELKVSTPIHLNGTSVNITGGSVVTKSASSQNFAATTFSARTDTMALKAEKSLTLSSKDPNSKRVDEINLNGNQVSFRGSTTTVTTEFESTYSTTTFSVDAPETDILGTNVTLKASRDFFIESSAGSVGFAGRSVAVTSKDVAFNSLDAVQLAAGDDMVISSASLLQLNGGQNLVSSLQALSISANISPMEFVGEQIFLKAEALDYDGTDSISFETNANGNSDIELTTLDKLSVNADNSIKLASQGFGHFLFSPKGDITVTAGAGFSGSSAKTINFGTATTPSVNFKATQHDVEVTTANYLSNSDIYVNTPQFIATAKVDNFVQCQDDFDVSTGLTIDFTAGGTTRIAATAEDKTFAIKSLKAISYTAGTTLGIEGRRVSFSTPTANVNIAANNQFALTTLYEDIVVNSKDSDFTAKTSATWTLRNHLSMNGIIDLDVTGGDFKLTGSDTVEFLSTQKTMTMKALTGDVAITANDQVLLDAKTTLTFTSTLQTIANTPDRNMTVYGKDFDLNANVAGNGTVTFSTANMRTESGVIDVPTTLFKIKSTTGDARMVADGNIFIDAKQALTFEVPDMYYYAHNKISVAAQTELLVKNSKAGNHITLDAASDVKITSTGAGNFTMVSTAGTTYRAENNLRLFAVNGGITFNTNANTTASGVQFNSDGNAYFNAKTRMQFSGTDIKYIARDGITASAKATVFKGTQNGISLTGEQSTYLRSKAALTLTATTLAVESTTKGGTYHWTGKTATIAATNAMTTKTAAVELVSTFNTDIAIDGDNTLTFDVTGSMLMSAPTVHFATSGLHKMYADDKMFLDANNDGAAQLSSSSGVVELSATRRIRVLSEGSSLIQATDTSRNNTHFIDIRADNGHLIGNDSITFNGDSSSAPGIQLSMLQNNGGKNGIRFTSGGSVSVVTRTNNIEFTSARDFLSTAARSTIIRSKVKDLLLNAPVGNIGFYSTDGSFSAAAQKSFDVKVTQDAVGSGNAEIDFTCGGDFDVFSPTKGFFIKAKGYVNGVSGDGITLSSTNDVGAISFISQHRTTTLQSKLDSTFNAALGDLLVSGAEGVDMTASSDVAFTANKGHVFIHGAAGTTVQAGDAFTNINDLTITAEQDLITVNSEDTLSFTANGEEGRDSIELDATFGHIRAATSDGNDIRVSAAREVIVQATGNYTHHLLGDLTVQSVAEGHQYSANIDATISSTNGPVLFTSVTGGGGENQVTATAANLDITSGDQFSQFARNSLTWTATQGGFDFNTQRQVIVESIEKTSKISLLSKDDITFTTENPVEYAITLEAEKDIFLTATDTNSVNANAFFNVGVGGTRPEILMHTDKFTLTSTGNILYQSERTIDVDSGEQLDIDAAHNVTIDSEGPFLTKSNGLLMKATQGSVILNAVDFTISGATSWTGIAADTLTLSQTATTLGNKISVSAPTTTTFTTNSLKAFVERDWTTTATGTAAIKANGNINFHGEDGTGSSIILTAKSALDFSTNSGNIDLVSNLNRAPLSLTSNNKDITFTTTKTNSPIVVSGIGEVALKSTSSKFTANSRTGQAITIAAVQTLPNDNGDRSDINITASENIATTAGRKTLISAISDILIQSEVIGTGVISFSSENDLEFDAGDKLRVQNQIEGKGKITLIGTDDVTIDVANAGIYHSADKDLTVTSKEDIEFQDATWFVDSDSDINIKSTGAKASSNEGIRIESTKNNVFEGINEGTFSVNAQNAINVEAGFLVTSANSETISLTADALTMSGSDVVAQFKDIKIDSTVESGDVLFQAQKTSISFEVSTTFSATASGESQHISDDGHSVKFFSNDVNFNSAGSRLHVKAFTQSNLAAGQLAINSAASVAGGAIKFDGTGAGKGIGNTEFHSEGNLLFLAEGVDGDIALATGTGSSDVNIVSGGVVSVTADNQLNINCQNAGDLLFDTPSSSVNSLIKVFAADTIDASKNTLKSFYAKSTGPSSNVIVRGAGGRTGLFATANLNAKALYGDIVLRGNGERRGLLVTSKAITLSGAGARFATQQKVVNALLPSINVKSTSTTITYTTEQHNIDFSSSKLTVTANTDMVFDSGDNTQISGRAINMIAGNVVITHDIVELYTAFPAKSNAGLIAFSRDTQNNGKPVTGNTGKSKTVISSGSNFLMPVRNIGTLPSSGDACTIAREFTWYQIAKDSTGKFCVCNPVDTTGNVKGGGFEYACSAAVDF